MARNGHSGVCYRCGHLVRPGEGHFEKVTPSQRAKWPGLARGLKWLVQHAECATRWRGTARHYLHAPNAGEPDRSSPTPTA